MKIIETRPRVIGFVLWDHCQNLLDDPRIIQQYKSDTFRTDLNILLQNWISIPKVKSGPHLLPIQDILSEIVAVNLHF